MTRDTDGLQVDFMGTIHGVRSFEGLRDRASTIDLDGMSVRVASLDDIIRSKRAARRPRDLAVLDILEKSRAQASSPPTQKRTRRRRP
jgi:predicted nucleotidyltransferase